MGSNDLGQDATVRGASMWPKKRGLKYAEICEFFGSVKFVKSRSVDFFKSMSAITISFYVFFIAFN